MKKRFVTIVPHGENLELRKDTGQLPYHMGKQRDVTGTFVTYYYTLNGGRAAGPVLLPPDSLQQQQQDYPYLLTEVQGLNIDFLPYIGRGKFYDKAIVSYIRANASKIDMLNLFHFGSVNVFYAFLYKLHHPAGKVYLKLDIDIPFYKNNPHFFNSNSVFGRLKVLSFTKIIEPLFFSLVHTISAESQTGINYFSKRYRVPQKKMMLVPNGVDADQISKYIPKARSFDEKENILVTVGRIGSSQKNNQMLLAALSAIKLGDWQVYFIGEIEPGFHITINEFFEANPEKREQVFFTGRINTPETLYRYYDRAKVFCLTSRDEGFPLSACEAAYFGNYMVLSDHIDCFDELTAKGQNGIKAILDDVSGLSDILSRIIAGEISLADKCEATKDYALANLTWQAIVPRLYNRLTSN